MAFDHKISLVADGTELFDRQADIDLNDAVAACTGEVMVVSIAADAIVMATISEFHPIEQSCIHQLFNRAVDGSPAQRWFALANLLPQIINRKICPTACQFHEPLFNQSAWTGTTLAHLVKGGTNLFGYLGKCIYCFFVLLSHRLPGNSIFLFSSGDAASSVFPVLER